jgi:hypothetical protein
MILPPPSYGGGAPSYGAEGEGPQNGLERFQIWNQKRFDLQPTPSGPAGHLPRMTGEAKDASGKTAPLRYIINHG